MTERAIAVRFYENKRFGKTYGKGMYHKAVFNATADVQLPRAKYLLDMYDYNDWINTAKTDADMEALGVAEEFIAGSCKDDLLATWLKRIDSDGTKQRVEGFGVLDLETGKLVLVVDDKETGIEQAWKLDVKPCKPSAVNKNSPQLLATNIELS